MLVTNLVYDWNIKLKTFSVSPVVSISVLVSKTEELQVPNFIYWPKKKNNCKNQLSLKYSAHHISSKNPTKKNVNLSIVGHEINCYFPPWSRIPVCPHLWVQGWSLIIPDPEIRGRGLAGVIGHFSYLSFRHVTAET